MTPRAAASPCRIAPRRRAVPAFGPGSEAEPVIAGSPVVVLVAETDRIVRWATSEILAHAGFETRAVCTAADALAVLEEPAARGMLITGRSIVGDGVALAHLVHHRWPSVGIIVTSGIGWDHQRDLPPGARLLRKPYAFADIVGAVEAGLAAVRAAAAPVGEPDLS